MGVHRGGSLTDVLTKAVSTTPNVGTENAELLISIISYCKGDKLRMFQDRSSLRFLIECF